MIAHCEGCDELPRECLPYVVTFTDGTSSRCMYCDDCAELARMNWNGETAAIERESGVRSREDCYMRPDLEWLAYQMATRFFGDRSRRFYVYRVAAFGDYAHYDERFEHLYKAGSL